MPDEAAAHVVVRRGRDRARAATAGTCTPPLPAATAPRPPRRARRRRRASAATTARRRRTRPGAATRRAPCPPTPFSAITKYRSGSGLGMLVMPCPRSCGLRADVRRHHRRRADHERDARRVERAAADRRRDRVDGAGHHERRGVDPEVRGRVGGDRADRLVARDDRWQQCRIDARARDQLGVVRDASPTSRLSVHMSGNAVVARRRRCDPTGARRARRPARRTRRRATSISGCVARSTAMCARSSFGSGGRPCTSIHSPNASASSRSGCSAIRHGGPSTSRPARAARPRSSIATTDMYCAVTATAAIDVGAAGVARPRCARTDRSPATTLRRPARRRRRAVNVVVNDSLAAPRTAPSASTTATFTPVVPRSMART